MNTLQFGRISCCHTASADVPSGRYWAEVGRAFEVFTNMWVLRITRRFG
jgi:hypothetical protein